MSESQIGVLLVGDNQADLQKIADLLAEASRAESVESEYGIQHASSLDQALETLREGNIQAILLDMNLPGGSGLDLINRALALDPALTVVLLLEAYDEALVLQGLQAVTGSCWRG